jgi:membrane protein YqaA with SNARE-associated domain
VLRRVYDWVLRLAAHKHASWALAAVSFIESSVFPIPPDVLLIPMVLADRRKAWMLAAIATTSSVAGGFLGYAIGYYLFDALGQPILEFYHVMDKYDALKHSFDEYGAWIIIAKGMTPIPYKLITIASGALHFDLATFTIASVVSRAMRFFLVAGLFWAFGPPIRAFVEKWLTLVTTLFVVFLIGGFVAIKYLF